MNSKNTRLTLIIGVVLMSLMIFAAEAGSQQLGRRPFLPKSDCELCRATNLLNSGETARRRPLERDRSTEASLPFGPGSLDPTFDADGKLTTEIGEGTEDFVLAAAIQPDGKIVAAGVSYANGSMAAALVRYTKDGSLDTSFGLDGKVITPAVSAYAVAIQSDGKIVAAGDNGPQAAVFRYNSDGSLDPSFGVGGIVSVSFYDADIAYAVALQPDGKIVIAGYGEGPFFAPQNHTTDFALARLNADGTLDASFGVGGKVIAPFGSGGFFADVANSVIIQGDGKIVAAGWAADFDYGYVALVRLNSNGSFDNSFGNNGKVLSYPVGGNGWAVAATLQPDGKIVAAGGYYNSETDLGFAITRYKTNGSLDTSFDTDGFVTIANPVGCSLYGVAIQPNGRIIAAGGNDYNGVPTTNNDFAVFRLNADGSRDTSFGVDGKVTTDFFGFDDSVEGDVVVQPDGKILATGLSYNGGDYDFALARYSGDSAAPARPRFDFDGDGRSDVSVFRPSEGTWYLNRSTEGFAATQFGLAADKLAPADYDGDGKTDIAVYREGVWYRLSSANGAVGIDQFGVAGDIPVPADYTGDGRDELAVLRNGAWWIFNLSNAQVSVVQFGLAGDKPVPADYDGDGRVDHAVYRGNGEWHLNRSSQGYAVAQFGLATDKPVIGDYDGDEKTDLAVYRDGTWYLLQSTNGFAAFQFGIASDTPAPADYDGDGRTDAAIYRNGEWWSLQSTGGVGIQQFGLAGDRPIPSSFVP